MDHSCTHETIVIVATYILHTFCLDAFSIILVVVSVLRLSWDHW